MRARLSVLSRLLLLSPLTLGERKNETRFFWLAKEEFFACFVSYFIFCNLKPFFKDVYTTAKVFHYNLIGVINDFRQFILPNALSSNWPNAFQCILFLMNI